jgi:hypothetical protein
MDQEEIRHKVMTGDAAPVVCLALVVPTIPAREDHECYNYEKKWHLSNNCPQPRNTEGIGGGRWQRVVHLAITNDSYNTTDSNAAEITELEELKKFKL